MIKDIVTDFSRVLLFPRENDFKGSLNRLHEELDTDNPDYPFFVYFRLNRELLNWLANISKIRHVQVHMLTTETIQKAPILQPFLAPVFIRVFSAMQMGISKREPQAYQKVAKELDADPSNIIYIDDLQRNIDAARLAGMVAVLYQTNQQVMTNVEQVLQDQQLGTIN